MTDTSIEKILTATQSAVNEFQKSIPGVQQGLLSEITVAIKEMDTAGGRILNNVRNLKLVNNLRNKIERLIVSEGYKKNVKKFVKQFDNIEALQLEYFASFNAKFTPSKTLPLIKETAIDRTLNDLLAQGLQSNVVDRIHSVLTDNTTTGGSYASLTDQLRGTIVGTSEEEGLLQRYARTITTDAVNQYSAQYHDTLAQDLSLNWGRYIGSLLTTSREFCKFLTEKDYVHRSELPTVLEGMIDGHQCKLNKKGLPLGMIPGTDKYNFNIRRGGYNCGHQFFYIADSAVPAALKAKLKGATAVPVKEPPAAPPAPKKVPVPKPAAAVKDNTKKIDIKALNVGGFDQYRKDHLLEKLGKVHPKMSIDEKIAVMSYTGQGYDSLNRYMRGENKLNPTYHESYKNILTDALDKLPDHKGPVFRGGDLPASEIAKYTKALKSGSPVEHDYFTSTSSQIGDDFEGNVKMAITSKTGKLITDLSLSRHEKEVLFKAGTKFKVLKIEKVDGETHIKMEEV